jgi:hypothetical protein
MKQKTDLKYQMTPKTEKEEDGAAPEDLDRIVRELMQMYVVRINGQDVVLLGPILGWPDNPGTEVESFGFGQLVHVSSVIEMLQRMQEGNGVGSVMSKMQ